MTEVVSCDHYGSWVIQHDDDDDDKGFWGGFVDSCRTYKLSFLRCCSESSIGEISVGMNFNLQ